jgi:hypothetical protein
MLFFLRTISRAAAATLALGALALSVARAESPTIVNPNFSAVPVQCSEGSAYQSDPGGTCESVYPEQDFNTEAGIGWAFTPYQASGPGIGGPGITEPNSGFNPPPFTGLPFSQAAYLQNHSLIYQKITGFVLGQVYKLTLYLGSRYSSGGTNGNQIVVATLDGKPIGVWRLTSFTPFVLQTAFFKAPSGGSHILGFQGIVGGTTSTSSTGFFSGVSIEAVSDQP